MAAYTPRSTKARRLVARQVEARAPDVGRIQAAREVLDGLLLAGLAWDELLLALANAAFDRHAALRGKAGESRRRRGWLKRCKVLHDAMELERSRRHLRQEVNARRGDE